MKLKSLLLIPLVAAALTGCTVSITAPGSGAADPEQPAAAPPTTSAEPTPTEAPTPEPTRGPDSPVTALDVYDMCIELALTYYQGDPALIEFTPFDDAQVVTRDDGYIYTYIEVIDRNQDERMSDDTASECIMGGTLGDWDRVLYGVTTRHDDRDPNAPLPTA
jgi:hypothetical protein